MSLLPVAAVAPSDIVGNLNNIVSAVNAATATAQAQQTQVTGIAKGLAYKGASPSSFTVPAGALGIWSVIRTGNYNGPCLNIRRSSDNATQDIGFLGDVVDYAAADAFIGPGNTGFVTKQYDQSGSGNNLTQVLTANQPVFIGAAQWNGIRPWTEQFPGNSVFGPAFLENATVAYNANPYTIVTVARPRESYTTCNYFRGAVNQAGADVVFLGTALSALLVNINGTGFASTAQVPGAGIKVAAVSSGASTIVDFDGVQTTSVAATALALGYIAFGNALITSPQQYNFHGDYFFQALYPSAFTGPQLLTLRTTLLNAFVKPAPNLYNLVWGGNSLLPGYGGSNAKALSYVAGMERASIDDAAFTYPALPNFKCYQLGSGGRTMLAEYTARATWLVAGFDATKTKNIYIMCDVSNDISLSGGYASTAAAQAAMNTLYATTFLLYLAAIKAAGYTAVICSTVVSRGDIPFQLGFGNFMDDARVYWNALLRSVASSQGFILSDRAANPPFSSTTGYLDATNYATDKVHPTDAGNLTIAGIDLAAILAA